MRMIGFIGLGHMGTPMVKNLIKNNYSVKVFDIVDEAIQRLLPLGAQAAHSASAIAKEADVVITMLQTGEQVKQTCLGDNGLFAHFKRSKSLYLDCSSIDVKSSRELHEQAKAASIAMLDAPVSGGVAAAEAGTLTFMVGGEEPHLEWAFPFLAAMGKKVIHAGPAGSGVVAKICNNMILGISMIAVSESFLLGERLGLDPKKLFDIVSNASGQCWSLTQYCPYPSILPNVPSSHDYQPGFSAKMMLKDLELSQDAANLANTITKLGKEATLLYKKFVDTGNAEVDFSGIIRML
ncbi:MAG: 3-hydroxyisobutyrate dehydrogenase [Coxiella sp. RIFCSPHIGHO2_12_FULL_44_14]|nr:MAG: 3-hydroxyisobutyrate dehydrogenase [Coxiella sp. RIFCSPHIGHO2_12_FULL_44_14]